MCSAPAEEPIHLAYSYGPYSYGLCSNSLYSNGPAEEPIHLALLIPVSGTWDRASSFAGAAALAVDQVNADKMLLAGRALDFSWADSGCSPEKALAAMGELLRDERRIDAVIGPHDAAPRAR